MAYRGFSFTKFDKTGSFTTSGIETVKIDLMNHLMTEKGSRVYMPNFGTCLPTITFENGSQDTVNMIITDVKAVIDYDPRVKLVGDVHVFFIADRNTIVVQCEVFYTEYGVTEPFNVVLPGK